MKYAGKMKREFEEISAIFPQLKEWKIDLGQERMKGVRHSYGCVYISRGKRKYARIYPPSNQKYPNYPKDYMLHEIMHILLRDIKKERNRSKSGKKEEHLIRSILNYAALRKYFPKALRRRKRNEDFS